MRTFTGILIGITLTWCATAIYRPALHWAFTRIPPDANPTPRYRTWRAGIETFEEAP